MERLELSEDRRREYLEKIRKLRLMDDEFFSWCMEGSTECVELILRIIMDKEGSPGSLRGNERSGRSICSPRNSGRIFR